MVEPRRSGRYGVSMGEGTVGEDGQGQWTDEWGPGTVGRSYEELREEAERVGKPY